MKAVLAIDLDQTLVFSTRSAGPLEGIDTVWVESVDGKDHSLMTRAAHALLADLQQRHHVVPVTTRTPRQYRRITLPEPAPWAVTCNGGILLRDGRRDHDWDARVAEDLRQVAPIAEAWRLFARVEDRPWVKKAKQVEDLFCYLVGRDRGAIDPEWVSSASRWAEEHGWTLSVQGRKAYLVPDVLSKGAAALRVAEQLGGPLLSAGDSLLDRSLLEAAVVAVRPAHGELHLVGYDRALVTDSSGVRAGEELPRLLAEHADGQVARHRGDEALHRD